MSWLEGRLPKWGPFGGGSTAVLEREETPEPDVIQDNSPRLMVLVNDASGFACFKTHTFPDAQAATDFVLYWFRHDTEGFTAFWAMTEEPLPAQGGPSRAMAEPLVMIKDEQRVDVVYSFSFVDIESAQAFIQDEVKNGADPAQITLYWAVPVRLESDALGCSILTPSVPPAAFTENGNRTETAGRQVAHEPAVENITGPKRAVEARNVFREAPNAHTGVSDGMNAGDETFELTSWIERARKKPRSSPMDDPSYTSPQTWFEKREAPVAIAFEPIADVDEQPLTNTVEPIGRAVLLAEPMEAQALISESPERADPEFAAAEASEEIGAETPDIVLEDNVTAPMVEDSMAGAEVIEAVLEGVAHASFEESALEPSAVESVELPEGEDQAQQVEAVEELVEPAGDREVDVQTISTPVQADVNRDTYEPQRQADKSGNGFISLEPFDIVVHTNGHAKAEPAEPAVEETEAPEARIYAEAEETDDDETTEALEIRIDIQLGSSRAMKVKRWGIQENPFTGFKSPRGRF
jgi:hypothetical protein